LEINRRGNLKQIETGEAIKFSLKSALKKHLKMLRRVILFSLIFLCHISMAQKSSKNYLKLSAGLPSNIFSIGYERRLAPKYSLEWLLGIENFNYDKTLNFQGLWRNYYGSIRCVTTQNDNGEVRTLQDTSFYSGINQPIGKNQDWTPIRVIPLQIIVSQKFKTYHQGKFSIFWGTGVNLGLLKYLEHSFTEKILAHSETIQLTEFPTPLKKVKYLTRYEEVRESKFQQRIFPNLMLVTALRWQIAKHFFIEGKILGNVLFTQKYNQKLPRSMQNGKLQGTFSLGFSF
jgi:hypothetical protein